MLKKFEAPPLDSALGALSKWGGVGNFRILR